jgi:hypothetical protein
MFEVTVSFARLADLPICPKCGLIPHFCCENPLNPANRTKKNQPPTPQEGVSTTDLGNTPEKSPQA